MIKNRRHVSMFIFLREKNKMATYSGHRNIDSSYMDYIESETFLELGW